ncbi:MAG: hypothetical protein HKL95_04060 [Phycisphaerae bacterium]|nr:hypothetical protein [Phycisphaerae bacterium]
MNLSPRWQGKCGPMAAAGVLALVWGTMSCGSGVTMAASQQQIAAQERALSPKDAIGHEKLARMLYDDGRYQQALKQVDASLKINPAYQDAQLLKSLILSKIAGQKKNTNKVASTQPGKKKLHRLLTMDDIYKIRLWELSRHESGPLEGTIVGGQKTLLKFWRRVILQDPDYQNPFPTRRQREGFISPDNFVQQVRLMLRLGQAKYWDKVHIHSEPQAMRTFRQTVEPVVLQSCATVGCHRGQGAPGFRLFGAGGRANLRQTYTNFYVLNKLAYKGRNFINRGNPPLSLLYQYLLPRDDAAYRHPGKPERGPRYHVFNRRAVIDWIESLRFPAHRYGITDFHMPVTPLSIPTSRKK